MFDDRLSLTQAPGWQGILGHSPGLSYVNRKLGGNQIGTMVKSTEHGNSSTGNYWPRSEREAVRGEGVWYHVAWTFDAHNEGEEGHFRWYINGQLSREDTSGIQTTGGSNFKIGADYSGRATNSKLAEVRLYDRILTEGEILELAADDDFQRPEYPSWWGISSEGSLQDLYEHGTPPEDHAPATVGQLKYIAAKARDELEAALAPVGGAGPEINAMVDAFGIADPDDYGVANLGQLKYISAKFFDRFAAIGFTMGSAGWPSGLILDEETGDNAPSYPWLDNVTPANSSIANIGQLKLLFSWNLLPLTAEDADGDGLPDYWENYWFGDLRYSPDDDPDRDGMNNLLEYENSCNPSNPDTDGDTMEDMFEYHYSLNATSTADNDVTGPNDDPDGDGLSNLTEFLSGNFPDAYAINIDQTQIVFGRHVLFGSDPGVYYANFFAVEDIIYIPEYSTDLVNWHYDHVIVGNNHVVNELQYSDDPLLSGFVFFRFRMYLGRVDEDGDGMPDWWEAEYGVTSPTANDDSSGGDVFNNVDEYRLGLVPNDPLNPDLDTDSDGIPDSIEFYYAFLDPNNPEDAFEDEDGDRYPNVFEIYFGTDPENADPDSVGPGEKPAYPSYGDFAYFLVDETLAENSGNSFTNIADAEGVADDYNYSIIEVLPGDYEGKVSANAPMLVLSRNSAKVTSIYSASSEAVLIDDTSAVLNGFTLSDSRQGFKVSGSAEHRVVVKDCIIRDNGWGDSIYNDGGGIHLSGATLTVDNTYIHRNTCDDDGAGIYQHSGDLRLTRSVIMENTAGDDGGGIFVRAGDQTVIQSTIANNIAEGNYDGVYFTNSSYQYDYTNTLIWNPKDVPDWTGHIYLATGLDLATVFTGCLTPTPDATGNLQVNHLILSPAQTDPLLTKDGHLQYNSPAIDKVAASTVLRDIDGEAYPLSASDADIGADEYTDSNGTADADGLPDWIEALGIVGDFDDDDDSDGLSNGEEYILNTPITDPDIDGDGLLDGDELYGDGTHGDTDGYVTDLYSVDTDLDGMPDAWEGLNGLNPTDGSDAFEDVDGDRYPNAWEYVHGFQVTVFGTDPDPDHLVLDAPPVVSVNPLTGGDSSSDLVFSTLRAALDAVNMGSVGGDFAIVHIAAGIYEEYGLSTGDRKILILGELGSQNGQAVIKGSADNVESLYISGSSVVDGLVITHSGIQSGSGVRVFSNDEDVRVRLINCIIRGNVTNFDGGAIKNSNVGLTELIHCTLTGNRAEGSGSSIFNSSSSHIRIANSILWDQVDLSGNDGNLANESIYDDNSSGGAVVVNSIVRGGDFSGINEDPVLTAEGWLRSDPASSAIDPLGVNLEPSVSLLDLNGEVRGSVGAPDLGADEFINTDGTLDDTLPDWFELRYGGVVDSILDDDGHADADMLTNFEEYMVGTDPADPDTDGDTLLDDDELSDQAADGDTDGLVTDPLNPDDDFDGMPTLWEIQKNISGGIDASVDLLDYSINDAHLNNDGDLDHNGILENPGDTLTNLEEYQAGTHPLKVDTDGDQMPDSWELAYGLRPSEDDADLSADSDALTNLQEYNYGTAPDKADTDNDYIDDDVEIAQGSDPLDPASLGDHVNLPVLFDFEKEALASLNGQNGWEAVGATVIKDVGDAGNQLVQLTDDDNLNHLLHPIAPSNSGREVFINFDAKLQLGETFDPTALADTAKATILLTLDASGRLMVYDGVGEVWIADTHTGITYADTWHHYEIKLNTFNANWSLLVDGATVFQSIPARDAESYTYYFWSFYYQGLPISAGPPVLIDNLTLSYDADTDFNREFMLPLSESFIGYSNSNLILASENVGWDLTGVGAAATINTQAPPFTDFDEDGFSLELSAGSGATILSHGFEPQSGYVTARFAVRPVLLSPAEAPLTPSTEAPIDFYVDAGGTLFVGDGSVWSQIAGLEFVESEWYVMTIVYNVAAQTWRLGVNDQTVATDLAFSVLRPQLNAFKLIHHSNTALVFDALTVAQGAPPLIAWNGISAYGTLPTGQSYYKTSEGLRLAVTAIDMDTEDDLLVEFFDLDATDPSVPISTDPYGSSTAEYTDEYYLPAIEGGHRIYAVATDTDGFFVESPVQTIHVSADSDGDGLPDRWETDQGWNTATYDGTSNPDGDAYDNNAELLNGSDPTDYYNVGHPIHEVIPQILVMDGDSQTVTGPASQTITILLTDQAGDPLGAAPFTLDSEIVGLLFDWDADPSDGAKPLSGITEPNGTETFTFQP
nr:LamG-like jellyroll fold domain-containing protein [Puniceicoccus vermicola]